MVKGIIARAFAAALVGAAALALFVGSAAAQSVPDTLVTGTITGATSGTVGVYVGGTACTKIAGGTIVADGTYQIVVNCAAGTATLYVNGAPTTTTFTLTPGVPATGVNAVAGAAPTATATATTAPSTVPSAPSSGNTAPAGSSSAWMFLIAGLGALALGVGGVVAVSKSR